MSSFKKERKVVAKYIGSVWASHPAAQGLIHEVPKIYYLSLFSMLLRFIDGSAQSSGQWLNDVDQTHRVPPYSFTKKF